MARNVISDTRLRGASASKHGLLPLGSSADTRSKNAVKQDLRPLALSISDGGSEALIEMPAPVQEPEVTKKKRAINKAQTKTTKTKSKKPLPKPARVAKKAALKSPVKRASSSKLAASVELRTTLAPPIPLIKQFEVAEIESIQCSCPMEIERLGSPNDLGISAIASAAQDATPPWKIESAGETDYDLSPIPRSAALQLYGKRNWWGSAGHWIRSNILTLFVHRQKVVAVTRPTPKKLTPRDMICELNRLAEENRALRRKLAQYGSEE